MRITKLETEQDRSYLSKFIKVKAAADILGVTRNTVYSRMRDGILATTTICSDLLFYRDQVQALADRDES